MRFAMASMLAPRRLRLQKCRLMQRHSEELIIGAYLILFGLATGLLEFQIPPYVARYATFFFSFLGRGVFYIFIGSITLNYHWSGYATGAVIMFVGFAYVVLEFMPQIEPPANMREADQGWGAEQV